MKLFQISVAILVTCGMSWAILPAYPDRTRQIQLILIDGGIETMLADEKNAGATSGVIDAVEFLGLNGPNPVYRVRSGKCLIDVTLEQRPIEPLTPIQYDVKPSKLLACGKS